MIDIKKLKENAEPRNFTLDENEGNKWSRARMGRIIATILHAANDCQEKCKYCGDRLYVGEAVGTALNTDPIFMAERPEQVSEYGFLGTLNGVIKVYLAPDGSDAGSRHVFTLSVTDEKDQTTSKPIVFIAPES